MNLSTCEDIGDTLTQWLVENPAQGDSITHLFKDFSGTLTPAQLVTIVQNMSTSQRVLLYALITGEV